MNGPAPAVLRARTAVYAAFILNGFVFSSWIARIPSIRDTLGLTPGSLSLLLLSLSAGSVVAMPVAGAVVLRAGRVRTVLGGAVAVTVGMSTVALAVDGLGLAWVAGVGLFVQGVGIATWDVAMNVEGSAVERRLDRAIMSRFHAGYSFGTVLSAGLGVGLLALGVPTWVHLLLAALVSVVGAGVCVRSFLDGTSDPAAGPEAPGVSLRTAWTEPRTLLIGVMVLCMAFVEGTANDWLAVGVVDGHGTDHAVGVAGYAVFVVAMTLGRLLGPVALDRVGRVAALRGCAALAVVGVLVFVLAPSVPVALVGAALWGVGAALGFPLGMSAAGDEERNAAVRVSVVSSVGYAAFLAGPPVLGLLADETGVLRAITAAAVAAAVALLLASAARPHVDGVALGSARATRP